LEGALELYRGEFLTGFHVAECGDFERWLQERRSELRDRAAYVAARLVERAEAAGSSAEAVRWARRALTLKPDDEGPVQRLVTLLDRMGDRAAALREYEAFVEHLATAYGVEPSPETQATIAGIRMRRGLLLPAKTAAFAESSMRQESMSSSIGALTTVRFPVRRLGPLALMSVAALLVLGGALLALRQGPTAPPAPAYPRTAIAVLPFQNLSAEGEHAYFAGGLHDEILTQLSKVAGLKVISRTSVMEYGRPDLPPLRQIAGKLGVGSLAEASVQVVGGRFRVNVQLVDAATGATVWAEHYDRTLDDAFAIQSDVAHQIVRAVGAALSADEQRALAAVPTVNPEAYRFYLHGKDYFTRPGRGRQNFEIAEQLYERALALDPNFALAHAALSVILSWTYFVRQDSPDRMVRAREEAEAGLRLAPDLAEARIAMGAWHYWGRRDYQRALEEFATALDAAPNNAFLWQLIAAVHRRLGNWEEVFTAFERATQLNPLDADLIWDLGGNTYSGLGRYPEAVRAYDRALSLVPDLHRAAISKGWAYVQWRGELDTLRAALRRVPDATEARLQLLLLDRNADSLLRFLATTRMGVIESQQFFVPRALYAAWAHQLRADGPAARAAFESALALVDSVTRERPDDWRVHVARGLALAGLGRRNEARTEARWLRQSAVYRDDAIQGPFLAIQRARILAQAGEANMAVDEIERLNAGPSPVSVHMLRLDHTWDPIRNHPRFRVLLAKHADQVPQ
ncbi:MAG: hypothetical protein HY560_08465, partial [Gemmatimonadetes bacterium]|nr:hypothetical protein [Gemmatimonadota bacterium]